MNSTVAIARYPVTLILSILILIAMMTLFGHMTLFGQKTFTCLKNSLEMAQYYRDTLKIIKYTVFIIIILVMGQQ